MAPAEMALFPGTRIGAYEVLAKLGEGGMGEVYRARDTKLGRDVALKFLSEAFAGDPDRLTRFEREARTLASLNHPHIANIHGVEEGDGKRALVMEFVDGEDLSARISRGPIPLDEALPIARQIAEALEAAHDAGIIHRDLKPANIKVRPDGTVKVLDFGLAKALDSTQSGARHSSPVHESPTITSPAMTAAGLILGTAAYMSPEQAKGRPVDKRADLWAFGCVLYEMLTAQRAFPGEDISETLASILAREPDFGALPPELPPALRALIVRCLARDPKQRVASPSTVLYVLTSSLDTAPPGARTIAAGAHPAMWRRALPAFAAAVVAGAFGVVAGAVWLRAPAPKPVTRFSIGLPPGQIYTNNNRQLLDVSPDGSRILYAANLRLYVRSLADAEARPIPGSDLRDGVQIPTFSPDGEWVAFWTSNTLKKIPVAGGTPITLYTHDSASAAFGLSWDQSRIVFAQPRSVLSVSPNGGEAVVLATARDGETMHRPQVLPDGRHLLYTLAPSEQQLGVASDAQVVVQDISTGERTTVVQGLDGRYLSTGHLLYRTGATMMVARFDPRRLTLEGPPVAVADAAIATGSGRFATHLAVSASGTLAYVAGTGSSDQDLAVLNRRGQIERRLGLPGSEYSTPRVSPDGRRVAYGERLSDSNVWVTNLDSASPPRRLTFGGRNRFPVWSSDGQHIAFQSDRGGDRAVYWQRADGNADAERLTTPEAGTEHAPEAFSPNGEYLLIRVMSGGAPALWWWSRRDRSLHRVEGESMPASNATFSPDGRWIAYTTTERNRTVSFVRPFPVTAARYQVPIPEQGANMAIHPVWLRTPAELIYSVGPGMLAIAPVVTQSTVDFGVPSVVQIPGTGNPVFRSWDITPDGQHIVRIVERGEDGTLAPPINVVLNWFEELNARVAPR